MTKYFFDVVGDKGSEYDFHGRPFAEPQNAFALAHLLALDLGVSSGDMQCLVNPTPAQTALAHDADVLLAVNQGNYLYNAQRCLQTGGVPSASLCCPGTADWTIGHGILKGLVPYRDLYETKPPGIFLVSALSYLVTGGDYVARALRLRRAVPGPAPAGEPRITK